MYHDYIKDEILELKNTHPILLNSKLAGDWYQHYKNFRQNFFFTENEIFLFRGYYDLIYSTFPIQKTNDDTLFGAFVYGGFRSKTSRDKILDFYHFPILDNHDIKNKCFKIYLHLSKHLKTKTLYFSIKHEILNHLAINPTLEDISNILKVSQRKIKNEISNQTNLTFSNFVSKLKLEHACHQLQYTDNSIHDISDSIGFMNTSSFIRFFKNKTSQTPLDYRKR
ncbi:helix-turn-helix domain-containing protein [Pseudolactococcus yaeyamensis]